jgi:hypothetical protein
MSEAISNGERKFWLLFVTVSLHILQIKKMHHASYHDLSCYDNACFPGTGLYNSAGAPRVRISSVGSGATFGNTLSRT